MINMNKLMLQEIIKQCTSVTMNNQQMQLALFRMASYLKENEEGKAVSQSDNVQSHQQNQSEQPVLKWKEYVDQEIERIQQVLTRKLAIVEKLQNRTRGLYDDVQNINQIIEQQENSILERSQELAKSVQRNENSLSMLQNSINDQIKKLKSEIRNFFKNKVPIKKDIPLVPVEMIAQTKQQFYNEQKWSSKFTFDGKTLTKLLGDWKQYQFVFFEEIPFDKQFSFKIKIVRSEYKSILIGIVDYQKQKQQQFSSSSNNAVCYDAFGQKHPSGTKELDGFQVGQTVEVKIDRKKSLIRWFVNNKQKASYTHEILSDQTRKLMPYIEMEDVGHVIQYSL